ncbi:type VII secretion-associated serine protease mycosin [Streptomyces sp. UNOB3_S3]|uniref:type VII secretion-associated serine protease mycosin n=1 Tax=Streptomyces sp. UNOB3_S3 TaxID=2871682 RepID=UPI001E3AD6BF|nr:type VII secretion-associated serine protease mycosin [Streptomyces sp. UNOB3_S3]MCC3774953.1 type VII secretion-associated serine protease mycosin [Streptomyces sp. UNOB3_S3]
MRFVSRRARLRASAMLSLLAAGFVITPQAVADDMKSKQWYLDAMQADDMWKASRGEGMTVAVVDSGVDSSVPELQGQVLQGTDVSNKPLGADVDRSGHGTEMAALIAGTGASGGIQGLAPGAKILPVRIKESGLADAADPLMARGIRYAADHGAQIINISQGGPETPTQTRETEAAVKYAVTKGKLIFAASGNDGDKENLPSYPANMPGVVSVGAIDRTSTATKWSNSASNVALAAPGDEIPGRCKESAGFCATRGTSQATALASASAALIWSKHPDWTGNQVLRVMMDTAGKPTTGKIPSPYIGYGIVRPRKVLLDGEGNPGPADVNPLLAVSEPASPSPKPSARTQGSTTESRPEKGGGSTTPWLGISIGTAAVAVVATATILTVRQRRRTNS